MRGKLLIHIIDSLALGGAEMLLRETVNLMPDCKHIIVRLYPPDTLAGGFSNDVEHHCLDHSGWSGLPLTVRRLKRIIRKHPGALVHSHLFVSSIIARLATPANVPLVNSIHSTYSIDAFSKNRKSVWAERLTLKRRHTLVAVSDFVLKDYLSFIPFNGKRFVLHNFLPEKWFAPHGVKARSREVLRGIAVGTLKEAKNYFYLLDIVSRLPRKSIAVDIWGEGPHRAQLEAMVREHDLPVTFRGSANDLATVYRDYDFFLQVSTHEGFGLSVVEAMASGLPTFISDIPVFREVSGDHARFLPLGNASAAAEVIGKGLKDSSALESGLEKAFAYCRANYTSEVYLRRLLSIYEAASDPDKI